MEPHRVVRLLEAIAARSLDAVTFTSAPAAEAMLLAAEQRGLRSPVLAALRNEVIPFSVGPVTAAPLHAAGIDSIHPDRYRLGALVRVLCEYLTEHQVRRVQTRQGLLEIRGRSAAIDGRRTTLSPTSVAVLRLLADAGGAVVPKTALQKALPEAGDDHAARGRSRATTARVGPPGRGRHRHQAGLPAQHLTARRAGRSNRSGPVLPARTSVGGTTGKGSPVDQARW